MNKVAIAMYLVVSVFKTKRIPMLRQPVYLKFFDFLIRY